MVVTKCKECPFFHETLVSLLARVGGVCAYDPATRTLIKPDFNMPPGPEKTALAERCHRRLVIHDQNVIPDKCPLRTGSVTIRMAIEN